MSQKKAGIYVRVSTERQVLEGYSIAAQKENLTNFANNQDFIIYDIYADEGISGKNIQDRPNIKRLIRDIKDEKIDVVLLQQFDRLTRSVSDTQEFIDLFKKYDVDVWSINDGGIVDITSSNGRFMTLLKGLFGQHERELIAERIKFALSRKAREGYTLCCGCCPYGYNREKGNKVIIINENEAMVVKRIFKMYIDGNSFTNIAKILNSENIPTKQSGKTICIKRDGHITDTKIFVGMWSPKSIKLILSNPVYIGKVRYGINRTDYYIGYGYHKPIIDNNMWEKVQNQMIKMKKKVHTNYPKDDGYFCNTLICGLCGERMTTCRTVGRLRKDGSRKTFVSYKCINKEKHLCNAKFVSHNKVESAFIEYLEKNIAPFDSIDINLGLKDVNELNNIQRRLTANKVKKKEIMNLFIWRKIDYNQFSYMYNQLDVIIRESENNLLSLNASIINKLNKKKISICISDYWKTLTNNEKLIFLNNFIEYITIINNDNNRHNGKAKVLNVKFM